MRTMKNRFTVISSFVLMLGTFVGAQVTPQRLARAADEAQNWLMYSGGYFSQRYSPLKQLDRTNVKTLEMKWILPNQVRGQISALFLLVLNLGGLTLGPNLPPFFSDFVFRSERMIGAGLAASIALASVGMLITFLATCRPYRTHSAAMDALA